MRTGRRGDQHVRVLIDVPTILTDEQKELIRKLAKTFGGAPKEKKKGFFENLGIGIF
jgi:molecular chaperone DnaJ